MMQISMKALADLFAEHDIDLADHPDLAAQVMVLNEQLAAAPGLTPDVMGSFLKAVLRVSGTEDEHP